MRKKQLKATAIILILCIIFLTSASYASTPSLTDAEKIVPTNKFSINEFDMLQTLSRKPITELQEAGYSSDEIAQIQNYEQHYEEHIRNLQKMSTAVLRSHGYTEDQINGIRNYAGNKAELRNLSSTITLYSSTIQWEYDGNYTRGRLAYGWYWNGQPSFKMRDLVAVGWNTWVVESQSSYVDYYGVNTGLYYQTQSAELIYANTGILEGAGHRLYVAIGDNNYYAKQGGGSFVLRSDVHSPKDFYYYMEYGHKQIGIDVGFSIGIGSGGPPELGISISFSTGITSMASDYGEVIIE